MWVCWGKKQAKAAFLPPPPTCTHTQHMAVMPFDDPGPHARYTDGLNEFQTLPERAG